MKKSFCVLALLVSATASASNVCIYTDNKVTHSTPNGNILTISIPGDGDYGQIVSLDQSSGLISASLAIKNGIMNLVVQDASGKEIYNESTSDADSGLNFLRSFSSSVQASLVCTPLSNLPPNNPSAAPSDNQQTQQTQQ